MENLLVPLGLVALAMVFLCVRLFAGKRFVHTHVDGNKELNRRGIHCAQSMDASERRTDRKKIQERKK